LKISNKADYALLALFTLMGTSRVAPISARAISDRNKIPLKFLEHILREMKEQGWIESSAGKYGGYWLARKPSAISIGEVIRHFDGLLGPTVCSTLSCQDGTCPHETTCRFRWLFLDIQDYATRLLDSSTLESVAKGPPSRKKTSPSKAKAKKTPR
jgi:Rrf2 family protein